MVLIVEKEITLFLCVSLGCSLSLLSVSLFSHMHTYTHTCSNTCLHILEHRPTYTLTHVRLYAYKHMHMHSRARTCTHTCIHVHTRTHTLSCAHKHIFCFEDCFLNQIKALQPTKEQRPSALESGGWTEQKQEDCKSKACWGNAVSPFSPTSGVTC